MKIFYTATYNQMPDPLPSDDTTRIAKTKIPELLAANPSNKVITYFVDDTTNSRPVSDILADIRSADAFIGEMSLSNQTLGFELAYANLHFVPSLYLYHANIHDAKPDNLITDNPTRKLWVKEYTESELEVIIKSFIRKVERQMETARTSFMSTKEIDDFISNESDSKGIPKGEVIRQILAKAARE